MEEFLNRISAPPPKKKARKFLKISTDEDGSRTLHVAVPRVECDRNEAAPENYVVTTLDLGRPTGAQIVEECDNSFLALKDRLFKKEGKYKRLKREHKALIGYVQQLSRSRGQDVPVIEPPADIPRESISGLVELGRMAQEADRWVTGVRAET